MTTLYITYVYKVYIYRLSIGIYLLYTGRPMIYRYIHVSSVLCNAYLRYLGIGDTCMYRYACAKGVLFVARGAPSRWKMAILRYRRYMYVSAYRLARRRGDT